MYPDVFRKVFGAGAIYLPDSEVIDIPCKATVTVVNFAAQMAKLGFDLDERLFRALCHLRSERLREIYDLASEVMGAKLNWTPLVRNWKVPTGATYYDTLVAVFANVMPEVLDVPGTTLPCGHVIPVGTFPLERYNGCPLCGRPFATSNWTFVGQESPRRLLHLWGDNDVRNYLTMLLQSAKPLDGTEMERARALVAHFGVPEGVDIPMRETAMMAFLEGLYNGHGSTVAHLVKTPADILRALWADKTGERHVIPPKVLIRRASANVGYKWHDDYMERFNAAAAAERSKLQLKFNRSTCGAIARILNQLPMSVDAMCENMNPQRGMWVRFIRALRLTEYARRPGMGKLAALLDHFYRHDYTTWRGQLDKAMAQGDVDTATALLCKRPGEFARGLFSAALHLDADAVLDAFDTIADSIEMRLLLTLAMYSDYRLDPSQARSVRLPGGSIHILEPSQALLAADEGTRRHIADRLRTIVDSAITRRLASRGNIGGTVYIAPSLDGIMLGIGERSQSDDGVTHLSMGSSVSVRGEHVRAFIHWGEGLPAQHLDMDLSACIQYKMDTESETCPRATCAYYTLDDPPAGTMHSGDIQNIPDMVGAAEYIELDLPVLEQSGAELVALVVNAYTQGGLVNTIKMGWMDCKCPMKVDAETGVAYDPSTVEFITSLPTGTRYDQMTFALIDVKERKIYMVEIMDSAQNVENFNFKSVLVLMEKLRHGVTVGQFLRMRASAQGQTVVDSPDGADEVFTFSPGDLARVNVLL